MDDVEVLAVVPDGLVEAPNLARGPVLRCVLKQEKDFGVNPKVSSIMT